MSYSGYAIYNPNNNRLEVIRPGENMTRYISCINLNPKANKVHGVQVDGDDIWLMIGPHNNPRPNKKIGYSFSSLTGGYSRSL